MSDAFEQRQINEKLREEIKYLNDVNNSQLKTIETFEAENVLLKKVNAIFKKDVNAKYERLEKAKGETEELIELLEADARIPENISRCKTVEEWDSLFHFARKEYLKIARECLKGLGE